LVGWVNIEPIQIQPTRIKNISHLGGVAKRLDQFLVHNALLQRVERYQNWFGKVRCLDHFPIVLELDKDGEKLGAPFKYNLIWYEEEDF
jgi:hypothetical protein